MSSSTTSNRLTHNLHVAYGVLETNEESRSFSRSRNSDFSIVTFDDPLHDRQTQTTAFTVCRKHRIKNPCGDLIGNSRSVVFHRQANVFSDDTCTDRNSAFRGCDAKCVQNKVQQHSVHQLRIREEDAVGCLICFQNNTLLSSNW